MKRLAAFSIRVRTVQPGCLFGDQDARRRIVLFGDSHAAYWFSPLAAAADQLGWRLNAWTKSSCPVSDISSSRKPGGPPNHPCSTWRKEVMAQLTGADRPDVVILSSRIDYTGRILDPATGKALSQGQGQRGLPQRPQRRHQPARSSRRRGGGHSRYSAGIWASQGMLHRRRCMRQAPLRGHRRVGRGGGSGALIRARRDAGRLHRCDL